MNELKAFFEYTLTAAAFAGGLTPFIMAIVQGLGHWVEGKAQTIAAIIVGLIFGLVGFFGIWGLPASLYDGLRLLIFLAMTIGIPIGTYEAISNASNR